MKLKVLIGALVGLVIVNIAAVDTYLYYHLTSKSAEPSAGVIPEVAPREPNDSLLMLSEDQRNQLRDIAVEFAKSTGELHGRIRILDDHILGMIEKNTVVQDSIDAALREISALRLEISKIALARIIQTKSFLSREQQEQLFAAIFRSRPAASQSPDAPPQTGVGAPLGLPETPPPPPENRLKKLTEVLELTPAQIVQVETILRSSQENHRSLSDRGIADPSAYGQQPKKIMDEEDARIEGILTDVQLQKFKRMLQEGKESGDQRGMRPEQIP